MYYISGVNGLITKAILVGDIEAAVNLCILENRMADALILAMAAGGSLLQKTQQKYLKQSDHDISKVRSRQSISSVPFDLNASEV